MTQTTRRNLLLSTSVGAALSALPPSIQKALAVPAQRRKGTIEDVEHVVILMQENRSFDHYFGTFPGVRGFGDRFTIPLPGGRSVWQQDFRGRVMLPYHLDARLGNAQCVEPTPHEWLDAHQAWDNGRMTSWPVAKTPFSMGYYREAEVPFQFALASAFTLCDAYHSSMHAGTNPNRLFLWTGTNGPTGGGVASVLNEWDGPGPASQGYTWKTYPERLQDAGIRWKVYQYLPDNFGNNSLAGFRSFREAYIAAGNPHTPADEFRDFIPFSDALDKKLPLYKGNGNTLPARNPTDLEGMLAGFRQDVRNNRLPQVSWIVAPRMYSEHPQGSSPVQGAWFTQQILNILSDHPEIWSKTVLLVNYDENDGFFDHVPSPSAPSVRKDGGYAGKSTVPFDTELFRHAAPPGSTLQPEPDGDVYGPGPRVPMLVVSPWSRGGWVNSQVFDHTSIIQFLERRFHVVEPNISPWRRAVCGDLTSAFDFVNPNRDPAPKLTVWTRGNADGLRQSQEKLPQIPVPSEQVQRLATQRRMTRRSRALPYRLEVVAAATHQSPGVRLQFINHGSQGAVIHVYDRLHLDEIPRRYTVETGKSLDDTWLTDQAYDLWVLGPNGYHRSFCGTLREAQPEVSATETDETLVLRITNPSRRPKFITIARCPYTGDGPWTIQIQPGQTQVRRIPAKTTGGWYDVSLEGEGGWLRRLAGRIETGRDSISDPLMGT